MRCAVVRRGRRCAGLGVEPDQDRPAKLHAPFLALDLRSRDDARQMRKYQPTRTPCV